MLCFVVVLAYGLEGCAKRDVKIERVAISSRAEMPILDANDVSTLISDSGITRYRIEAEQWRIYDKATPVYWDFPQGIYLEKFDEQLHVNASLRSDYAKYLEEEQVWHLTGNVYAVNEKNEVFETPELYWNQKMETIYSDSVIKITREQSIIEGVGFTSNQDMTKYTILRPTGVFPIKEE